MRQVFLDTVGMLAVWDESDQWHSAADRVFSQLVRDNCRLITTSFVFLECGNAAARRPYRSRVNALRRAFDEQQLIVVPSAEQIERAWEAFDRGDGSQAGIVDQVSFVVMRDHSVFEALTNDRHFKAAGFAALF